MPEYLPADELKRIFPGISPDVLARSAAPVASVESPKREPGAAKALERKPPRRAKGKGRTHLVVSLISCRRGILDGDNCVAGYKPLRDAIAQRLGVDDGDPVVRWQYGQCETSGEIGTIVVIERL